MDGEPTSWTVIPRNFLFKTFLILPGPRRQGYSGFLDMGVSVLRQLVPADGAAA